MAYYDAIEPRRNITNGVKILGMVVPTDILYIYNMQKNFFFLFKVIC